MGLELKGNPSADTVRNKILEAMGEAPKEAAKPVAKNTTRITISEDPTNNQPVYVGHNGKSYRIRRGEPVDIPTELVEVLRNAVQQVPKLDRDGRIEGWKAVQAYPFQVH